MTQTKEEKKIPKWGPEYQKSAKELSRNDKGGANYTAEDLARLKKKWGIR